MKGDFSRLTFDPGRHYAGVLQQQGRVALDSDWNEDVLDRLNLLAMETVDIIGVCGFPEPGRAFRIVGSRDLNAAPDVFLVGGGPGSRGRGSVQGILSHPDQTASYLSRPDFPAPPRINMPTDGGAPPALVSLEVWQGLI